MDDLQGRRIWGWRAETKNLHKLPKLSIFDPVHCFSMIALSARRPPCRRAFFSPMATLAKGQARGNGDGRHRRRFLEGAARALARRGGGGGALFVVPLKAEGAFARAPGPRLRRFPRPQSLCFSWRSDIRRGRRGASTPEAAKRRSYVPPSYESKYQFASSARCPWPVRDFPTGGGEVGPSTFRGSKIALSIS